MSFLAVTTLPWVHDVHGRWVERQVFSRVEFVVDGRGLSEQVAEANAGRPEMVTLFELGSLDARSVLMGEGTGNWMEGTSRIPLLVCWCGDPHCGAVTAQFSRDATGVTWSDWAYEDYLSPPVALPLPTHVFEPTSYERALTEGKRLALANADPETHMRVRVPGPWWRNVLGIAEERTDLAAMRGWLRAEPVVAVGRETHVGYRDLVDQLAAAQRLIRSAASTQGEIFAAQRRAAIDALTAISESPHRISLPSYTLDSVHWHRDRLGT